MQTAKNAVASAKEAAADIGASAKSGMEKTKAVVQEKVEKMKAHNPAEKEMAEQKKLDRIEQAEYQKQQSMEHNAAEKERKREAGAGHATSAMPGQGTGEPKGGHVTSGVVGSHPIGTATGMTRPATARNPLAGGTVPSSHETGGPYS